MIIFNMSALLSLIGIIAVGYGARAVGLPEHFGWLGGAVVDLGLRFSNRDSADGRNPWFSGHTGGQLFWILPVWLPCIILFLFSLLILAATTR